MQLASESSLHYVCTYAYVQMIFNFKTYVHMYELILVSNIYTNLEYAGSVGCSPGIQEVVFAGTNEPFSAVGKFQRQNAAFV